MRTYACTHLLLEHSIASRECIDTVLSYKISPKVMKTMFSIIHSFGSRQNLPFRGLLKTYSGMDWLEAEATNFVTAELASRDLVHRSFEFHMDLCFVIISVVKSDSENVFQLLYSGGSPTHPAGLEVRNMAANWSFICESRSFALPRFDILFP